MKTQHEDEVNNNKNNNKGSLRSVTRNNFSDETAYFHQNKSNVKLLIRPHLRLSIVVCLKTQQNI